MNKEEKVKQWAYKRMFAGAVIGFFSFTLFFYFWKVYPNKINPIAGIGLLFIGFIGVVTGAIFSLFSRKWNRNDF